MTDNILPLGNLTTTMNAMPLGVKLGSMANIDKTSQDFEAMFATQMLQPMFEGLGVDPTFGGGHGEEVMRSFLLQEYGKEIARTGRLGIAAQVKSEMIRAQEAAEERASGRAPGSSKSGGASRAKAARNAYATASAAISSAPGMSHVAN